VRRNRRWPEAGMRKCEVVFAQALSPVISTPTGFPNLKVCDKRNTDRQAWDMVQIASGVIDKMKAKYKHTNVIARDWRRLAEFYHQIFGCNPVLPGRSLAGEWVEQCTGVAGGEIRGVHLRLPGYGDDGPTLEIFQYNRSADRPETVSNRPGFAHLAFEVGDVEKARDEVMAAGGGSVGDLVTLEIPGAGTVTLIYVTDPERNIIELQKWQ